MAFTLIVKEETISQNGTGLKVVDATDWSNDVRGNHALFLHAEMIHADKTVVLSLEGTESDPLQDLGWIVAIPEDGRLKLQSYTHIPALSTDTIPDGETRYLTDSKIIARRVAGAWVEITDKFEQVLTSSSTSEVSDISLLYQAKKYKNELNLKYITQVKQDLAYGADQNELYYKRTGLDYINALIIGAEYNFGLSLYTIYYNIVDNINEVIKTGKLK